MSILQKLLGRVEIGCLEFAKDENALSLDMNGHRLGLG